MISASISRKEAIYSGTRFSIARQLAPMQIGIRKAVSTISSSAMPSMPSAQLTPPPIGSFSTNCHCAPLGSKAIHSQAPSARSSKVATSAIQRAASAFTKRHRQARDQRDGDEDGSAREGCSSRPSSGPPDRPGRRADQAEKHHQRVGIEVARLER